MFVAFSKTGLSGFGGVMPFAYRMLVERRRWLTDREFAQTLAMAQILPGATICNLAVMVGWRFGRLTGAVAATTGVIVAPMMLVIAIGLTYAAVADHPAVQHALAGMSAVAAGLVLATAIKMARGYVKEERRTARASAAMDPGGRRLRRNLGLAALFAVLAFASVAILRWPLILVVIGLAPPAIALSWLAERGQTGE